MCVRISIIFYTAENKKNLLLLLNILQLPF